MTQVPNMVSYFLDRAIEQGWGDRTALRFGTERISYRTVVEQSHRVANGLRQRGGQRGQRVLIACSDRPEFVYAFFGTVRAGLCVTMADPSTRADRLESLLRYIEPGFLVVLASQFSRVRKAIRRVPNPPDVLVVQDFDDGDCGHAESGDGAQDELSVVGWSEWLEDLPKFGETAEVEADQDALWLFTSGSSGQPKAAQHGHEDFVYAERHYAQNVLALKPSDITASTSKLFFGYATGSNLLFPLAAGATATLFEHAATPAGISRVVVGHEVTVLSVVPSSLRDWLAHESFPETTSLRLLTCAGEALPGELTSSAMKQIGADILDGLGSAEMCHVYVSNRVGNVTPGCLGTPVPGYEVEIVDDAGKQLPDGDIGIIQVRGGSRLRSYWKNEDATNSTIVDGAVRSGDSGYRDEYGRFWFAGRRDDLIKVAGRFVVPREVESALENHSAVAEAVVFATSTAEDVGELVACVCFAPDREATTPALQAHCRRELDSHRTPKRIEVYDHLPRTERGKVDRVRLRRELTHGR